jgi:hypothetical protein
MKLVELSDTSSKEYQSKTYRSIVNSYYGMAATTHDGPQTFLVSMPDPGSTIEPHFHDVDQYQVIVQGGGRLGLGQAAPVAFHYADAYTPYGPIVGGQEGISFFTIRAACATGYFPMPESRKLIPGKPGRNIAGQFDINKSLPAANQSTKEKLLEAKEDNALVVGLRLGPNANAQGEPTNGGDQYYLVCTGSLVHAGKEVMPMSMIRLERGEATLTLKAGAGGAEVLLLQLPMPTARIGSNPQTLAERKPEKYKLPEGVTVD